MDTRGLTLIELLIAIVITSILIGTVVFMLKSSLDAYNFAQEEIILQKVLDETQEEISTGGFENYDIKDSLEILSATSNSISFVPLWIDDSHMEIKSEPGIPITLNRPFKPGAALPIAEVSTTFDPRRQTQDWNPFPITFILGTHKDPQKPDDEVMFNEPLPSNAQVRFVFHPDVANFPDCAVNIRWAGDKLIRTYKGKSKTIPKYSVPGVTLKDCNFRYFDNTNTPIPFQSDSSVSKELLAQITAVKITLMAQTKEKAKEISTFINLRNSRTAGIGTIIRQGTRLKIPDSRDIRVFSLANIMGVKEGDIICIEARPKKGTTWRMHIELGIKDNLPLITKYVVDYPPGLTVYSETVNLTADLPLNFLTLGGRGLYDYDFDKDVQNIVDLKGEVELVVSRMDCAGAALFIRP